jgi:hypothetical protein
VNIVKVMKSTTAQPSNGYTTRAITPSAAATPSAPDTCVGTAPAFEVEEVEAVCFPAAEVEVVPDVVAVAFCTTSADVELAIGRTTVLTMTTVRVVYTVLSPEARTRSGAAIARRNDVKCIFAEGVRFLGCQQGGSLSRRGDFDFKG